MAITGSRAHPIRGIVAQYVYRSFVSAHSISASCLQVVPGSRINPWFPPQRSTVSSRHSHITEGQASGRGAICEAACMRRRGGHLLCRRHTRIGSSCSSTTRHQPAALPTASCPRLERSLPTASAISSRSQRLPPFVPTRSANGGSLGSFFCRLLTHARCRQRPAVCLIPGYCF